MIYFKNSEDAHVIGADFTPSPIDEIAFRLSHINRFNGSVGCYSVAQHSVIVSQQLPPELKLAGLLHDVCEAYLGDVTSPVKRHLSGYDELEDQYCTVVDNHYGVKTRHPLVREADFRTLLTEFISFGMPLGELADLAAPYDFRVVPCSALEAQCRFVATYYELTGGAK